MRDKPNLFERFANWATKATGSAAAFIIAVLIIVIWGITGPVFKFSDVWQLVINTGTTVVTFQALLNWDRFYIFGIKKHGLSKMQKA